MPSLKTCRYHRREPGIGICKRCQYVICAACCTQLDGINYCHACLKELAARPVRPAARLSPWISVGSTVAGVWALLFGLLLLMQGLFSG
jgi:hypothetical protein